MTTVIGSLKRTAVSISMPLSPKAPSPAIRSTRCSGRSSLAAMANDGPDARGSRRGRDRATGRAGDRRTIFDAQPTTSPPSPTTMVSASTTARDLAAEAVVADRHVVGAPLRHRGAPARPSPSCAPRPASGSKRAARPAGRASASGAEREPMWLVRPTASGRLRPSSTGSQSTIATGRSRRTSAAGHSPGGSRAGCPAPARGRPGPARTRAPGRRPADDRAAGSRGPRRS